MLLVADIAGVIAVLPDVHRASQVPPFLWLVKDLAFVPLQMARADAGENVVSVVELGIKTEPELGAGPRGEAKQRRLAIDANKVASTVRNKNSARAVCGQRLSGACPAVC